MGFLATAPRPTSETPFSMGFLAGVPRRPAETPFFVGFLAAAPRPTAVHSSGPPIHTAGPPETHPGAMPLSDAVLDHLRRQHGLVTRVQLIATGMKPKTADALVAGGPLEPVARGVCRLRGAPIPPQQAHMAATIRARARLTGEGLLAMLGVEGCRLDARPAVVVEAGRRVTGVSYAVFARDLCPTATASVGVIPAVRPEDAVLDFAADPHHDDRRVRTVTDAAQWKRVVDLGRLDRRAHELLGHPGARRYRAMRATGVFDVESEGERELLAFLGPFARFFRTRVTDVVPGRRLDLYEDASRLDLEYDGEDYHRGEADALRDAEVRAHDVEVIRVRADDIRGSQAAATLARILAVRASRVARLARGASR